MFSEEMTLNENSAAGERSHKKYDSPRVKRNLRESTGNLPNPKSTKIDYHQNVLHQHNTHIKNFNTTKQSFENRNCISTMSRQEETQ